MGKLPGPRPLSSPEPGSGVGSCPGVSDGGVSPGGGVGVVGGFSGGVDGGVEGGSVGGVDGGTVVFATITPSTGLGLESTVWKGTATRKGLISRYSPAAAPAGAWEVTR